MTSKQKHLLRLLREIDAICKKHHLRYVMAGGSLIGVVRHEGFVPWDDDVDIYMPKKDWDAFVALSDREFPPDRAVQCVDVTRNFTNTFPRYADTSSCVIHRHQIVSDDKAGEIIDVLTLDPIPDDDREYEKYRTHMMIYSELVGISVVYGARWEIPVTLYWKYLLSMKLLGRERTLKKLEKIMFSYKEEECSRYAMRWGGCPFLFDKDMMFPVKYGKFEDLEVMIPARTSDYLIWHYGDEWSYIPDHEERTSHMAVTVEGTGYEEFREEYMPGLDGKKLWREAVLRKSWQLLQAKRDHRIGGHRLRLYARCVVMDLKALMKRKHTDLRALREALDFGELSDVFSKYYQAQCSAPFVGREDFVNIYRFYHPILIELEDEVFYTAVLTLFYTERAAKAWRLLQVKKQISGLNEEMKRLRKDILRFRKAVGLYESRNPEESEKICVRLLERYPAHPGFLKLRCRFVMERARTEGNTAEAWGFLREAGKRFPGDGYFLKYEGDLLWMEKEKDRALAAYEKARTATSNGIVQLELDKFLREEKGAALRQAEELLEAGKLTEAEELLKRWRRLLPEDPAVQAAERFPRIARAGSQEELDKLEQEALSGYEKCAAAEDGEGKALYLEALTKILEKSGCSPAMARFGAEIQTAGSRQELEELLKKSESREASGEDEGVLRKLQGDIFFRQGHTDTAFGKYLEALTFALPLQVKEKLQKTIMRDWYHGGRKLSVYAGKTDASRYLDHWLGKYGTLEDIQRLAGEFASE